MDHFAQFIGFGAIIMILCLNFLKENLILLFIATFLVLSIWEYIVGVLLEKIFKTKYWDYSNMKFNIHGRVCLQNSIIWGLLGVIFICYLHPIIQKYIAMIPKDVLIYTNIIIGLAIIVDLIVSIMQVTKFNMASVKLNELAEKIKEKMEELKNIQKNSKLRATIIGKTTTENIEKVIKELKLAQERIKIRAYKHANRIKKAFPSIKSENITIFLNQKIDLKKLKETIKSKNKE